jgi:tellurite resistance-related uncharacterized protein
LKRPITGFDTDEEGDWRAILGCGHRQHVRHRPPFIDRPWVIAEEGRRGKLGAELECVRCDNFELPEGFVAWRATPLYTHETVPAALTTDHRTKPATWAKIIVLEGALRYQVPPLGRTFVLDCAHPGIVLPEVEHRVAPLGPLRFYLEFYRAPETGA